MSAIRLKYFGFISLLSIILSSSELFGQRDVIEDTVVNQADTSDYIPYFYDDALNYNLMIAASKGYPAEIERLIEKGADIEAETPEGATPLVFAVSNDKVDAVRTILAYKPVVDKITNNYETPLLIAVKDGFFDVAELLIRAGADINFRDRFGATSLHYAALYGYLDMADMLLYYDAAADIKSTDGTTPLLVSVWSGTPPISDLLLQNGANTEERDNAGYTPFLLASYLGDTVIMNILYKKGADIYAVNNSKYNALDLSIMAGQKAASAFLLRIGKWADQKTALDPYLIASRYRNKDMISTLQSAGIPGKVRHEVDQVSLTLSSRFFIHDYYSGFSLSFREPLMNLGFTAGVDTKLWYTRVLKKSSEDLYYQYLNKGSLAYAGLFRDFSLKEHPGKYSFFFSPSLLAGYSFGNSLKGTSLAPGNKFMIIPSAAVRITGLNLSFSAGLEYIRSDFYHTGPLWFRAGVTYNYYLDNVRIKVKPPRWISR
jgi:ankyrin repeat protein